MRLLSGGASPYQAGRAIAAGSRCVSTPGIATVVLVVRAVWLHGRPPHRLDADRGSDTAEEDDQRVDEVADRRSRLDRIGNDEDQDEYDDQQCRQPPRHPDRLTIAAPERQTTCQSCDRSVSVLSSERA